MLPAVDAFDAADSDPARTAVADERTENGASPTASARHQVFVSCALAAEWVGLEELAVWVSSLYFYNRLLARLDGRDFKLRG